MQHYLTFAKNWVIFKEVVLSEKAPTDCNTKREQFWKDYIDLLIQDCKIYRMDDNIKTLLALTKPPNINDDVPLPFDLMFLDVHFTPEELKQYGVNPKETKEIIGIGAGKATLVTNRSEREVGHGLRITTSIFYGGELRYETYTENVTIDDEKYRDFGISRVRSQVVPREILSFVHKFTINFINLLTASEVEVIDIPADHKRNIKRILRGKLPLSAQSIIRVTGQLKRYVDAVKLDPKWSYNYRFWVRGHFRTLRSDRGGERKGTRIWIPPFIKGKGVLMGKEYVVKGSGLRP